MKRIKKHRIKHEVAETSASFARDLQDHDLAYYIHDRVELMQQVFSVLKARDVKALAPECVRKISIDDLQELCTEELLGISSKRLCAILDGAEPPSDTESSSRSPSPVNMETISLDSISSDEEILGQSGGRKKKHKHRRRDSKSKSRHRGKKSSESAVDTQETCQASRAGLTVLELLELQARARAIRAQLQQEQAAKQSTAPAGRPASSSAHTTDNEVEIKEEAPEVVEISSEDEKPSLLELQKANPPSTSKEPDRSNEETSTSKETDKNKKDKSKKKDKKCKKKNIEERKSKSKDAGANGKKLTANNVDEEKKKDSPVKEVERNVKDSSTSKATSCNITESSVSEKTEAPKEITQTVTKRSNDLIITVPQQPFRRIKLNRSKVTVSVANVPIVETPRVVALSSAATTNAEIGKVPKFKEKIKKKLKRKEKKKSTDKEGSDHDEITLQLSDSEKMDLLEDFDRKHYDNVSSSSSEDSESSSDSDSDSTQESSKDKSDKTDKVDKEINGEKSGETAGKDKLDIEKNINVLPRSDTVALKSTKESKPCNLNEETSNKKLISNNSNIKDVDDKSKSNNNVLLETVEYSTQETFTQPCTESSKDTSIKKAEGIEQFSNLCTETLNSTEKPIDVIDIGDIPLQEDGEIASQDRSNEAPVVTETSGNKVVQINVESNNKENDTLYCELTKRTGEESQANNAAESEELSEGQLTDRESSEVEVLDLQPEVVCVPDDQHQNKTSKKKKKKEKKSKKEKKAKKSKPDFREGADQNFYRDVSPNEEVKVIEINNAKDINKKDSDSKTLDYDDDVYEILELSDDSSCYEVEGTVLSKEPTAEEIEALSAKIDEIERVEVITDQEIREYERLQAEKQISEENEEKVVNISWKDRYLGSKKVKRVLTTSNILNALRKKNKELKNKIEESKNKEPEEIETEKEMQVENKELEEGSIDHYNTLLASTKYVDPVPEPTLQNENEKGEIVENAEIQNSTEDTTKLLTSTTEIEEKNIEVHITGEMKKDAKLLLKMYKKLLKYNDMNKQRDPNKKKKKKKKERDGASAANVEVTSSL